MKLLRAVDIALCRFLLALVHGYQRYLGWLLGGQCRFVPSCSCYAEEALHRGPLVPALCLIIWRLLRCQPLCKGGMDEVPRWLGRKGSPPG
ncbi:membrane protein insertion efficiency factor YidD [Candidatus Sumerlaeota bacterium]|nr:membrane protein insertion efficiency factor YidD [Candidatus Sumerlaeota bacterium]